MYYASMALNQNMEKYHGQNIFLTEALTLETIDLRVHGTRIQRLNWTGRAQAFLSCSIPVRVLVLCLRYGHGQT